MMSVWRSERASSIWCIVGTAEYHVGSASSSHEKKRSALKPGLHTTEAPLESDDSTGAIRPWMWKSGITFRQRSSGVRRRVARMFPAEAHTFRCSSGTIFGREVVPEVWSTSATSSGPAGPGDAQGPGSNPSSGTRSNSPGPAPGGTLRRSTAAPRALALSIASESLSSSTTSALAPRSSR